MAIVELLDEKQYSEEVRSHDVRMREYTRAPGMTPYVRAAGHYPPYLEHMAEEHLYVMPTRKLRRRLKEMIAVAVSMVNGCAYCITAHSVLLRTMFAMNDAQLVELTSVVAHFSGVARFETATLGGAEEPLFPARSKEEVPLLGEIENAVGTLPIAYQIMANDPGFLESVWAREKVAMAQGTLDHKDKEFVAFATCVATQAPRSVRVHKRLLERMGATEEEIFEALEVVEIFHKNNKFTEGLQLEAGLWAGDAEKPTPGRGDERKPTAGAAQR